MPMPLAIISKLVLFSLAKKVVVFGVAKTYGFHRIYRRVYRLNMRIFKNPVSRTRANRLVKESMRLPRYLYNRVKGLNSSSDAKHNTTAITQVQRSIERPPALSSNAHNNITTAQSSSSSRLLSSSKGKGKMLMTAATGILRESRLGLQQLLPKTPQMNVRQYTPCVGVSNGVVDLWAVRQLFYPESLPGFVASSLQRSSSR
eukprot:jgi/Chlat1/8076/Chrsp75S07546